VMISADRESLLKYTWQPSVLSMDTVGTFPVTYNKSDSMNALSKCTFNPILHLCLNTLAVDEIERSDHILKHHSRFLAVICEKQK
jgi:hypothetical protein